MADIKIFVNGTEVIFPDDDQQPEIILVPDEEQYGDIKRRLMIPLRGVFSAVGFPDNNIGYDDVTRTVTIVNSQYEFKFVIGSKDYSVKDIESDVYLELDPLDSVPYINSMDRTMLPLKAPLEAIGCQVAWDARNSIVYITATLPPVPAEIIYEEKNGIHYVKFDPRQHDLNLIHTRERSSVSYENPKFLINASFFGAYEPGKSDARKHVDQFIGYGVPKEARDDWEYDDGKRWSHSQMNPSDPVENGENWATLIYNKDRTYVFKPYVDFRSDPDGDSSEVWDAYNSDRAKFIITGQNRNHSLGSGGGKRSAMGIRTNGDTVEEFIFAASTDASYDDMADMLESLGANHVLMLDGGGSTSFCANGDWKINDQGRYVSSVFVVE